MKIEKLNEKQIRCTLNKQDLSERQLRLSELAYGSDKAKALFQEMMQRASVECGFEAEDIPLMIEAIPLSSDCLVLVVTKVDDPEELDTRFSKFTSAIGTDTIDIDSDSEDYDITKESSALNSDIARESLVNCFDKISDIIEKVSEQTGKSFIPLSAAIAKETAQHNKAESESPSDKPAVVPFRLFRFTSMENVINTCATIKPYFKGDSTLFKMTDRPVYLLMVKPAKSDDISYNRVCGILSECSTPERTTYATMSFLDEHFDMVVKDNAVKTLAKM